MAAGEARSRLNTGEGRRFRLQKASTVPRQRYSVALNKTNQSRKRRGTFVLHSIEIDIEIVHGNAGIIHARSRQMQSLMLMGRSEDELSAGHRSCPAGSS